MANQLTERATATELLVDPQQLMEMIDAVDDLTMLPAVALEAMDMAKDPDCPILSFVNVIEKDPGLVSDILSLSNSAAYQSGREVNGIQHAVAVIGFKQCQNLIVSSSMNSLMKKLPPAVEWARDELSRHSFQTATIARGLNLAMRLKFDGEEFSGAMLHDVGRLLIAAAAPDIFEVVDRLLFCEHPGALRHEQLLMGTDHAEIGALFAESSGLPTPLIDVIRFHHAPIDTGPNQKLVCLVAAADHMANHLIHAGCVDGYDPAANIGLDLLIEIAAPNVNSVIELSESVMRLAESAGRDA